MLLKPSILNVCSKVIWLLPYNINCWDPNRQYRQCRWEAGEESKICDCTSVLYCLVWHSTKTRGGYNPQWAFLPPRSTAGDFVNIREKCRNTKEPFSHVFLPVVKGIITTSSSTTEVPWEGGKMFKGINIIKKEKHDFITWRALKLGPNTKFS